MGSAVLKHGPFLIFGGEQTNSRQIVLRSNGRSDHNHSVAVSDSLDEPPNHPVVADLRESLSPAALDRK